MMTPVQRPKAARPGMAWVVTACVIVATLGATLGGVLLGAVAAIATHVFRMLT